jgi:hypothetical protein
MDVDCHRMLERPLIVSRSVTSYIGGVSPGTDEGASTMRMPSPTIASASGTSMAGFGGRTFWARTRTAITNIQLMLMTPSATSISISPKLEPTQSSPNTNPEWDEVVLVAYAAIALVNTLVTVGHTAPRLLCR